MKSESGGGGIVAGKAESAVGDSMLSRRQIDSTEIID
jgi:hypothetical protein